MAWASGARNPFFRAHASSVWMEYGLTPEYTSILRWVISLISGGSARPGAA